jgi:hypothetical protein
MLTRKQAIPSTAFASKDDFILVVKMKQRAWSFLGISLRDFDSFHFVAKLHNYMVMLQILDSNSYDTVPLLGPRYWTIVRPL